MIKEPLLNGKRQTQLNQRMMKKLLLENRISNDITIKSLNKLKHILYKHQEIFLQQSY